MRIYSSCFCYALSTGHQFFVVVKQAQLNARAVCHVLPPELLGGVESLISATEVQC